MRLAPGVHRVGNGTINAYFIQDGSDITVVDAAIPGLWGSLVSELASIGRSLEDVRAILLTHGHSDHIGFAERLRLASHSPAWIHELDAPLARGEVPNPSKGVDPFHWRPILAFLAYGVRNRYGLGRHLGEVSSFGDGASLDVPGSPVIIHLPGHTPGSAAIHANRHGTIFVGDAIVTRSVATGRLGPQVGPFTADRAMALQSLARLDGVEAARLLPGHGDPWTGGVATAVALARAGEARGRR